MRLVGNKGRLSALGCLMILALLLIATIATRTPTGELISQAESSPTETVRPPQGDQREVEEETDEDFSYETEMPDIGLTVINIFWLAVFALVLLVATLLFVREKERDNPESDDQRELHDAGHRGQLRDVTSIAVDQALERIGAGAATDHAIIECWRSLGRAAAAGGVETTHSLTSSEIEKAIVGSIAASPDDVAELAELYRTARYSGQLATQIEIERAQDCLTAIRRSLT